MFLIYICNLFLYNLYILFIYLNFGCGGRSLLYSLSLVGVLELPLTVASLVAETGSRAQLWLSGSREDKGSGVVVQATLLLCAPQAQWHSTLCRCIPPISKVRETGLCPFSSLTTLTFWHLVFSPLSAISPPGQGSSVCIDRAQFLQQQKEQPERNLETPTFGSDRSKGGRGARKAIPEGAAWLDGAKCGCPTQA